MSRSVQGGRGTGDSTSDSSAVQDDPDLARIVRAWGTLPKAVRTALVAMVRAVEADDAEDHQDA